MPGSSSPATLGLDPARLWVTVYRDDDEAAEIWLKEIGVSPQRFTRMGESSNFWAMGDTGPCGPCSEIFYDHGPEIAGGPPGSPDEDGDRYVEIWNLVFMQFERAADGKLTPLPKPSVDTGMGLERMAAVMQGVHSNYDIDLFRNLIRAAAGWRRHSDADLELAARDRRSHPRLQVSDRRWRAARRTKAAAMCCAGSSGAPSAMATSSGIQEPFFYKLVPVLEKEMGAAFPELTRGRAMSSAC